jgi:putative transcriptional regulator
MPEPTLEATPGATADLEAPVLLIAMPQVLDPFFFKSLVLLIHHTEEGSVGLIVNRPTGIEVREILAGMEIAWGGEDDVVTWFGGPVQPQIGTVLFDPDGVAAAGGNGHAAPELAAGTPVADGLALTQHVADLGVLAAGPPQRFRLFLGYAGWGSGQLMEEILRNDWLTAPVTADLVFAGEGEEAWAGALAAVGVDPATLPSWTPGGDDDDAN